MKTAKILSFFLAAILMAALFAGCASETGGFEEGTSTSDDIVNTTAADKVLLVVSFGTSFNQSRELAIGGIEKAMKDAYPDYQVRRAFTAQIIIDKLAEREKLNIDNIEQAMDRLVLDKVKEVVVQPTTVMSGYEYDDVVAAVTQYAGKFDSLKIGKPLLTSDEDYNKVADLVIEELAAFEADDTTVLLMGHGTHHAANATYPKFEETLKGKGHGDILVGTVEGGVLIEDLVPLLKDKGTKKVVLRPLMIVAGDHANNDMAGDEEDTWKTILTQDGYTVETVIEGLGQLKGIQDIFIQHVQDAINSTALSAPPTASAVGGVNLENGVYSIEVDSDSSMFKIVECELTVENGAMTAFVTLSGQGFSKLYMGTAEAAAAASEVAEFVDNGERNAFTVSIDALDTELPCAGFSARRETWYGHTVTFKSGTANPVSAAGETLIDVTLTGGSGRAGVDSPAVLFGKDGLDCARIVWSSPNYTYMLVGGEKYLPVNTGGNAAFEIPITLDTDMDVIACTVAMSAPKEVEYVLRFDSATIR
jgi:sirohydrochlorin cobaltochelatase